MHEIAEYGIAAHALYKDNAGSPTEMLSRESTAYALAAPHHRTAGGRLQPGGVPRAHQARTVPRPGVLLHAQGQADRAAAQGDADRFCLCGAHRRRQHRGRLQDQRQDRAADAPSWSTATRSRSSPRRRRPRRRRPGNRSCVTGKARAAIRRATRVAVRTQYAGLGRRIVERLFQRAKIDYSDEKLDRRAAAAGARIDRRRDGGGRPQRIEGLRRRPRDVSRLQGRARRRHGSQAEVGKRLVRAQEASRRSSSRCRSTVGPAIPIRGINGDLPVQLCARRRRGAGRPHRRHPDAGRGHHHLPDPVAPP